MDEKFNKFLQTGKVEDYLKYKMGNIRNEINKDNGDNN